jgi:pimeloyl-ACP methyl ester carboxylesterase
MANHSGIETFVVQVPDAVLRWPGSVYESHKIIGPLTDPARYGGDPQDAFSVVAPSLPGYGFSDRPRERPMNIPRLATLFATLMTDLLGYRRFGAQGGDWGAFITSRLGFAYPDQVVGIHLNMVAIPPIPLSARTCLPRSRRSSNVWKPSSGRRPAINGFRARSHRRWAMA